MDESLIALRSDTSTAGLTREAFEALLGRLGPDPATAAEAYERLHVKLTKFFSWRGAFYAEALADETLNRVAENAKSIVHLPGFVMGVARNVFHEYQREQRRQLLPIPTAAPPEEMDVESLERALARLSPADRTLICAYYDGGKPKEVRRDLADRNGLTPNALRIRVCRIRERLVQLCLPDPREATKGTETFSPK